MPCATQEQPFCRPVYNPPVFRSVDAWRRLARERRGACYACAVVIVEVVIAEISHNIISSCQHKCHPTQASESASITTTPAATTHMRHGEGRSSLTKAGLAYRRLRLPRAQQGSGIHIYACAASHDIIVHCSVDRYINMLPLLSEFRISGRDPNNFEMGPSLRA